MTMHPKVGETRSVAGLGLRDFVCVMNRNMIFAAAMNVKERTERFCWHGRIVHVPTWKTDAPWTTPLHLALLIGRTELPQSKVCGVALLAFVNPRSGTQAARIQPSEMTVIGQVGSIEIDPVGGVVGEPFCLDAADHFDLLSNVIGSLTPDRRFKNIQTSQILFEFLGVVISYFPGRFSRAAGAQLHFVFPCIRVRYQVAHIGNVNYVLDFVAVKFDHPT